MSLVLCPLQIVGTLLNDHSPGVLGAAAAAFASICPNNFSLIGQNYQRLCETLLDVEEWGQIILIGILLRFVIAKHGLVRESIMFSLCCTESSNSGKDGSTTEISIKEDPGFLCGGKNFGLDVDVSGDNDLLASMISRCYIEGPDEYLSRLSYTNRGPELNVAQFTSGKSNNDVKILLQCTSPLLWSNNSAVVLAAGGVHWIMAPREDVKRIVKPLLFVLRSSSASKYVVLCISLNFLVHVYFIGSFYLHHFRFLCIMAIDIAFLHFKPQIFFIILYFFYFQYSLEDGRVVMSLHFFQVLCNIQVFAKAMPSLFAPHFEDFFICSSDSYQIKALKLEILSSIATDSSISFIFKEFQVNSPLFSIVAFQ